MKIERKGSKKSNLALVLVELVFGGLFGEGPIMKVNTKSPSKFINRGGQIPAPIQSLKN